jgi:hypothetical protein
VLKTVPPHVLTTWRARYLLEPWDWENRMALAKAKYEPPDFIQALIDAEKKIKRRPLTGAEVRRRMERSQR